MIELTNVSHRYSGRPFGRGNPVRALNDVTLKIGAGEAIGVVGVNGAGKSTLLRLLLGFLRPTRGEIRIGDAANPRVYVEHHGIAYVPERVAIPRGWTVRNALRAYAMLGDLGDDAWTRVDAALERLGLTALADRKVSALSKGTVQRLAIAQAILGDRDLMVLDEPTDGLDAVWITELRAIIADWRAAAPRRTLVIASHHLTEVEHLADRALLLHDGRLQGELPIGSPGQLEPLFLKRVRALEAEGA